jgi:hypothetical protein
MVFLKKRMRQDAAANRSAEQVTDRSFQRDTDWGQHAFLYLCIPLFPPSLLLFASCVISSYINPLPDAPELPFLVSSSVPGTLVHGNTDPTLPLE